MTTLSASEAAASDVSPSSVEPLEREFRPTQRLLAELQPRLQWAVAKQTMDVRNDDWHDGNSLDGNLRFSRWI